MEPTLDPRVHLANDEEFVEMDQTKQEKDAQQLHVTDASSQQSVAEQEPEPDAWKAGKRELTIIFCLCIISLVVALDATILVTALPTIATALGSNTLSTYWIGTSYLLTHAVVQPLVSALSDVFGRRSLHFASIFIFTAGSLIACLAHSLAQMLAGRVIQGIGGGGIIVMTNIIITDIIPLRQRPKFIALNQISWAVGSITGPLIGGAFAKSTTWRWIFYLNFPFCAFGLVTVPLVVKYNRTQRTARENLAAVDWVGGFLFTGGVTSFLMAISWGGIQFAWKSYGTLVPLLVGLLAVGVSLLWIGRFAKQPLIQLSIYRSRSGVGALICSMLQGFLLYLGLYYNALFFLSVKRESPVQTGVAFLPMTLALLPVSAVTGVIVTKTGRYETLVWLGWSLVTLGNGLLILFGPSTKTVGWVFIYIVTGMGQGMVLSVLNIAIQASVGSKYAADAAAMYTFMRSLGMALGVGVGGAMFQNRLAYQLGAAGLPTVIAKDAAGFVQLLDALPASDATFIASVIGAFAQAYHNLFELSTAVAATGLLASLLIRQSNMDQALETRHVLRRSVDGHQVQEAV